LGHDTILKVNELRRANLNRGTEISLVYEIFDKYMGEKDKLFLFYMVVAVVKMNE
jgi:hypothetical protein